MSEIKSAFEKAMEKVANLSAPTKEDRLQWAAVPKGQRLAAAYLQEKADLAGALKACPEEERRYVLRGAMEVLTANIQLPRHEMGEKTLRRALAGIKALLGSRAGAANLLERVTYVAEQYKTYGEQQRQQALQQLKQQFQQAVRQQLAQQGVGANANVNVEQLPEFQQEALRLKVRLEQQYEQHLDAFRGELRALV